LSVPKSSRTYEFYSIIMKNLLNLKNVKTLNKSQQKSIVGGHVYTCNVVGDCPDYMGLPVVCAAGMCCYAGDA